MSSKTKSSPSLLRILGALGTLVLVVFLVLQQANFLLSRAMLIAFGDSETTYRSAWFEWDGDIVAKQVVIYPYNLSEDLTIQFERVHLETPGWFWFVRNTFDRKLKFAKLDRIHLTLEGGSSDSGIDPSLGDLGPFGLDSASPFEAEGCASDGMWVRQELAQMGLDPQLPKLEFDYRVERNQLLTTVALESVGSSRVQLDRRAQLPKEINALLIDQYPHLVQSERWQVQDQGFVQARNRYCAKKDGVTENEFLARHAASVERMLEAFGIAVDDASRAAYVSFARKGGKLEFGGDYSPPIHDEEFYESRELGDAWPRMANAKITYGPSAHIVGWEKLDPRPLADLDEVDSTYEALLRERAEERDDEQEVVQRPAIPNLPVAIAAPAAPVSDPAAGVAQPPVASVASVAQKPVAARPNIQSLPPEPVNPRAFLGWKDMPAYLGQRLRLWTFHNPPRLVEILAVNSDSLRIRTRLGGGDAEYTVHRASFQRARVVR
jgi:hypothetical protein